MAGTLHRTAWRRTRMPALMTDEATVLRIALVSDGAGGFTQIEAEVVTVACSLQTQSALSVIGREQQEAGRVVASTAWTAYLPQGTDCLPADLLMVNGTRYEVVDSDDLRSDAVVMAVNLRRVV
jgi:hypothetical protein